MNDIGVRILIALIGAFATIAAAFISHDLTAEKYARDIERLTTEREGYRNDLEKAHQELAAATSSLNGTKVELDQLKVLHADLDMKYKRCVNPGGTILGTSSLDTSWHEETIATGDRIEFKLTASSMLIQLSRITKEGPVFEVSGCANPGILSATRSLVSGDNSYLIGRGKTLEIAASSQCCEKGLATCDTSDLENIIVECVDYNSDEQKSHVRFKRHIVMSGG